MATQRTVGCRVVRHSVLLAAIGLLVPSAGQAGTAQERRLHLVSAEASSYLTNDWNKFQENYLPLYVGDDDPHTAWSLKTEGIGEWIRMHVTPMESATHVRMRIRNGYQKSQKLFAANSRARQLTVVLLPSKKTVDVELTDAFGWQEIAVDQPAGALNAVELHVKAVYPGKKYDDLCLSDVQLYVTATSTDNPAYEKQHFEKIVTWKKERAAAASLFKTALGKALPVAAQYEAAEVPDSAELKGRKDKAFKDCRGVAGSLCWMEKSIGLASQAGGAGPHAAALRAANALAGAHFAGMTAVRIAAEDKRPIPQVDGLCMPSFQTCESNPCGLALPIPITGQTGYLRADGIRLTEQTGLPSFAEAQELKPPQCHRDTPTTFAWALRDGAQDGGVGRIRAVLLEQCGLANGREGSYPAGHAQLLVYGDGGQLEVIADEEGTAVLDWDRGADGAKLAAASLTSSFENDLRVVAAAAIAAQ